MTRAKKSVRQPSGGRGPRKAIAARARRGAAPVPAAYRRRDLDAIRRTKKWAERAEAADRDAAPLVEKSLREDKVVVLPLGEGRATGAWGSLEAREQEDAKGRAHRVVAAVDSVKATTVFRACGQRVTVEASEAMPQASRDFHTSISDGGEGAVLAVHDPAQSCLLRNVKRAQQLCTQNVRSHVHEGDLFIVTTRRIQQGEPLLEYWEWEGAGAEDMPDEGSAEDAATFWIDLGDCRVPEEDVPRGSDEKIMHL